MAIRMVKVEDGYNLESELVQLNSTKGALNLVASGEDSSIEISSASGPALLRAGAASVELAGGDSEGSSIHLNPGLGGLINLYSGKGSQGTHLLLDDKGVLVSTGDPVNRTTLQLTGDSTKIQMGLPGLGSLFSMTKDSISLKVGTVELSITSDGIAAKVMATKVEISAQGVAEQAGPSKRALGPQGHELKSAETGVTIGPASLEMKGPILKMGCDAMLDCKAPIVMDAADGIRQAKSGVCMMQ